VDNLLGGLLPDQLTGAGTPFTFTITKDTAAGPTPVTFPQPAFSNIAGVTIKASGRGPVSRSTGIAKQNGVAAPTKQCCSKRITTSMLCSTPAFKVHLVY
jgi:hypothetical protein